MVKSVLFEVGIYMKKETLIVSDILTILSISRMTFHRWKDKGVFDSLTFIKDGNCVCVCKHEFNKWLSSNSEDALMNKIPLSADESCASPYDFLTRTQLAAALKMSTGTLANWNRRSNTAENKPPIVNFSNLSLFPRYKVSEINKWLSENSYTPYRSKISPLNVLKDEFIDQFETGKLLGVSPYSLKKISLPYTTVGNRMIRYRKSDVSQYITKHKRQETIK